MHAFLNRLRPIWQPHAGQLAFLESPAKFKVLACGRRWGKTDACAVDVLLAMSRGSPTRHLILAPTIDQARILFERVVDLLQKVFGEEDLEVRRGGHPWLTYLNHFLMARSGHSPSLLRGHTATHIVVDEAAYVPEALVTEVAMPMLATTDGSITLISTPHGRNHFWRFFQMGVEGRFGIWSRSAPSSESPFVSRQFLEIQHSLISERAFKVEYEAEFLDSANQVFRSEDVEACLVTTVEQTETEPISIGIDWARSHDFTAVAVTQGTRASAKLLALHQFNNAAWRSIVHRVTTLVRQYPGAIVSCDATGVGAAVTEFLRDQCPGVRVNEVTFNNAKKQVMIGDLAWMFEGRSLAMTPHVDLMRQLEHFEAKTVGAKTVLAGAGSEHDDLVIALALAVAQLPFPYVPKIQLAGPRQFPSQP